jgi:hypothetical protein
MREIIFLISILFFHVIEDFYFQGWLASAKQKTWWIKNNPNEMYKYDYVVILLVHSFSWTVMIHIPILIYMYLFNISVDVSDFSFMFILTIIIHCLTDNAKANLYKINLIQDQLIHLLQIIVLWVTYINL